MSKRNWEWALDKGLNVVNREETYDEFLDECYGTVEIAGMSYDTSYALKNVDDIAYQCGGGDYFGTSEDYTELEDGTLVYTSELDALEEEEEDNE